MRSPSRAIRLGNCARLCRCSFAKLCLPFFRCGDQSVPFRLLAGKLAGTARRLGFFSCCLLRWLLIEAPPLHFAEHAFALHFLLQDAQSLIDVIVTNENTQRSCSGAIQSALAITLRLMQKQDIGLGKIVQSAPRLLHHRWPQSIGTRRLDRRRRSGPTQVPSAFFGSGGASLLASPSPIAPV